MRMNHHELYSMKNFDFLALSFARMHAQGHSVDLMKTSNAMVAAIRPEAVTVLIVTWNNE